MTVDRGPLDAERLDDPLGAAGDTDTDLPGTASLIGIDLRSGGRRLPVQQPAARTARNAAPASSTDELAAAQSALSGGVSSDGERLIASWRRPNANRALVSFEPVRSRLLGFRLAPGLLRRRLVPVPIPVPNIQGEWLPEIDGERLAWIEEVCLDVARSGRSLQRSEVFEKLDGTVGLSVTVVPALGAHRADLLAVVEASRG